MFKPTNTHHFKHVNFTPGREAGWVLVVKKRRTAESLYDATHTHTRLQEQQTPV